MRQFISKEKSRQIRWVLERSIYDMGGPIPLIFMIIGAIGAPISIIILQSNGYLIVSYIFFLIGLGFLYRKQPVEALLGLLGVIFLSVITLVLLFQKNYDILTSGLTLILVIITGWYAKNMHSQIKIMNNEKLGKVISEISRSIFAPLRENLKYELKNFETNAYIDQCLPSRISREERKRKLIRFYLEDEIQINSISGVSRTITRSAKMILNIEDEFVHFTQGRLKALDTEYNKKIDELNLLLKKFDDDFLPYLREFQSKCIDIANVSHDTVSSEDNYLKLVLKFTITQQNADPSNIGEVYAYESPINFINNHRIELYRWITDITLLKDDLQNMENKKLEIIDCLKEMIREINILHNSWKRTYYLTESEMQD